MSTVKKTCYHSELVKLGPIQVKIKSDVMESKFEGKPSYVIMIVDGNERNYSIESEQCEAALKGLNGRTVMLEATGSREEAAIKILGAGAAPVNESPHHEPKQQQNHLRTPMGPTLGMCMNNACNSLTAQGKQLHPHDVFDIASDLLRVCYSMEEGKLSAPWKDREAAKAAAK